MMDIRSQHWKSISKKTYRNNENFIGTILRYNVQDVDDGPLLHCSHNYKE